MPIFVINLLNFIPVYKTFLGIENCSQRKWWEYSSHEDENNFMCNYLL